MEQPVDCGAEARVPTPRRVDQLRDPELAALPSDVLLDELLRRLRHLLGADSATVLIVDAAAGVVRPVVSQGLTLDDLAGLAVPVGSGFAGRVAATARPLRVPDLSTLPDLAGNAFPAAGIRSLLGAPLVVEGQVIGVIHVGSRELDHFGSEEERLLLAAADRAAWAIDHGLLLAERARARDDAASTAERLRRLQAMSTAMLDHLDVGGVVDAVVRGGLSLLGAVAGALWEVDEENDTLQLLNAVGHDDATVRAWKRVPHADGGAAARAWRNGGVVVDTDTDAGGVTVASALAVRGTVIGVLGLTFDRAEALDAEAMGFLAAATAQCTAALHRSQVLADQERSLVAARLSAERLAALQRLTAALADVRDAATMVELIVAEVTSTLGAARGMLALVEDDHTLRTVASFGVEDEWQDRFSSYPLEPGLPATDALLTRVPLLLTLAQRDERYPLFRGLNPDSHVLVCLPLISADRPVGVLSMSLVDADLVDEPDLRFLVTLADGCAHALERARLLAAEARHRRHLELLAEAGRIFSAPLDVQMTSTEFCRLVVGRIADAADVHVREPDGSYTLAAAEHVDADQARAHRLVAAGLPDQVAALYNAVVEGGVPQLTPPDAVAAFLDTVDDTELRATLARRPPRSNLLLPLVSGGRALGVLSVSTVADGLPPLGPADMEHMRELAGRLALALDGAQLLRRQTEIAHTLQRSLLPPILPVVPGAEVAVRYLAGAVGVDVGGDFYDVIPLPSGRIGLVVGDVMGRGVRAAALMGQLRAAVRAYCLEGHPPAALLARLDRLVATLEEGLLVTAIYAEWDPQRRLVRFSLAGHLPPLVRLPGAEATFVESDPGVPLGVGAKSYVERELELPPGSLWLAYTDGLVEGPQLPLDDGMARLRGAVVAADTAAEVCDAALAELRPLDPEAEYDDDTAMLALVTTPALVSGEPAADADHAVVAELAADPTSPARARAVVRRALGGWGLRALAEPAALLVSELVTNAVRHAGTGLRVTVSRLGPGGVRVAVRDGAPGVPVRLRSVGDEAEGGRGLFLVQQLSASWGSTSDDTTKTVWFELR